MDNDTLRALADLIARNIYRDATVLLIAQVVLLALAAGIGAFLGEYLKTRGKNLATKSDFEDLKSQLHSNTEIVERIKSEFNQRDWAAREVTNIRRIKLEELLAKAHDCDMAIVETRNAAFEGRAHHAKDIADEVATIGILYFPELKTEIAAVLDQYRSEIRRILEFAAAIADLETKNVNSTLPDYIIQRHLIVESYTRTYDPTSYSNAQRNLAHAARSLMVAILKID